MSPTDCRNSALPGLVLDSVNAGIYVTDVDRRIVYWNQTAQRITGWRADQIVGKCCHEDVLCHVDKDDRQLCGKEFCPLHRAITTGNSSDVPVIVYARSAEGQRVPMRVSVAPLRDDSGRIIGGVETFMDISSDLSDLQRAQRIQSQCLVNEAEGDSRLAVRVHYAPHDMIGGDFCAISHVQPDRYAFIVADVAGHGLSAALYTMYLRSLWDEQRTQETAAAILSAINLRLRTVMAGSSVLFATAVCGILDVGRCKLLVSSAGGPEPMHFRPGGAPRTLELSGLPMGLDPDGEYVQVEVPLERGDRLLFFSDGVVEILDRNSDLLGPEGLLRLLQDMGYPAAQLDVPALEKRLLSYSNRIRFDDDLTIMEIGLAPEGPSARDQSD